MTLHKSSFQSSLPNYKRTREGWEGGAQNLYFMGRGEDQIIHSFNYICGCIWAQVCGTLLSTQGLHKHVDFLVSGCLLSPPPSTTSLPPQRGKRVACRFKRIRSSLLKRLRYSYWETPGIQFNKSRSYTKCSDEKENFARRCGGARHGLRVHFPAQTLTPYGVTLSKSIPHPGPIFSFAK